MCDTCAAYKAELVALRESVNVQLMALSRQLAHNTIDADAALAVVEHEFNKKLQGIETRVAALESAE